MSTFSIQNVKFDLSNANFKTLIPNNPLIPNSLFPGFFTFFMLFFNFQDLNMIAMPNLHPVLHKETSKQHFEE